MAEPVLPFPNLGDLCRRWDVIGQAERDLKALEGLAQMRRYSSAGDVGHEVQVAWGSLYHETTTGYYYFLGQHECTREEAIAILVMAVLG